MSQDDWKRPPPRAPRPLPAGRTVLSIFWGTPDEVVARWCGVSIGTARAYKAGRRKPSPAVVRLFMLHRDQRVLGPTWKGWHVNPAGIVDPDGNETSRQLLHSYFWVVQFSRRLVYDRDDPALHAEFEQLLEMGRRPR